MTAELIAQIRQVKGNYVYDLLGRRNVVGVGLGYKISEGRNTGELSLIVSVTRKEAPSAMAAKDLVPRILDGIKTDVVQTGVLRAEAGLSLAQLNALFLPHGWTTPVLPGTQHVTLGGMVAADVHGKNHHVGGCFGEYVRALRMRVADGRILHLIHRMLKAKVVLPDGTRVTTSKGTPQGGPLSPLLANVVLDELDWELERRGLRFVRYADDGLIFVRSRRAAERVMASTARFVTRRLRLAINEKKSAIRRQGHIGFLGFRRRRLLLGNRVAGRNQLTDDYIFLEPDQSINLAFDGGFGEHSGGLLEGSSG